MENDIEIITIQGQSEENQTTDNQGNEEIQNRTDFFGMTEQGAALDNGDSSLVTAGTETYRDFVIDNVLHSESDGDIHYNVYIPESYDGSQPYALYFTLPGYEGLYFQGVATNIRAEEFGFEARKYNEEMIIVAPQLSDWGEKSADQTIALVEYFLEYYNIDHSKVYANGYSGGGETMSIVMGKRPELFAAYLHCSSQWNGCLADSMTNKNEVTLCNIAL